MTNLDRIAACILTKEKIEVDDYLFYWLWAIKLKKLLPNDDETFNHSRGILLSLPAHFGFCFQFDQPRGSQSWMDTLVPLLLTTRGLSTLWLLLLLPPAILASYSIGIGRADSTGPTAEIVFVSTELIFWIKMKEEFILIK